MKVIKIENKEYGIYEVTLKPNWFEKLFGMKTKIEQFKDSGSFYTFGGQNCYLNKDGSKRGNRDYISQEIDKSRRKW